MQHNVQRYLPTVSLPEDRALHYDAKHSPFPNGAHCLVFPKNRDVVVTFYFQSFENIFLPFQLITF